MKLLVYIFLITAFFPYLKFFNIGTNSDIQLYALLFSMIILLMVSIKIKKLSSLLLYLQIYTIFLVCILFFIDILNGNTDIFEYLRGIYGYISFATIPLAAYFALKILGEYKVEKFLKLFYWIWVVVGIIQILNPLLFTGWRIRSVVTNSRGVISLSNEPAYFSLALIIITLILITINGSKNNKYLFFSLIVILLVAKSAVGLIYISLIILIYKSGRINYYQVITSVLLLISIIGVIALFIKFKGDSRLATLIVSLIKDPKYVLLSDSSLNIRFAHLFLAFKGFVVDYFIPHGVTSWSKYYTSEVLKNPQLFTEPIHRLNESNGRIVTLHGRLFYELGILCLPLYLIILKILSGVKNSKLILVFLFLGINGLNITNPMFGFLLGYVIFKGEQTLNVRK